MRTEQNLRHEKLNIYQNIHKINNRNHLHTGNMYNQFRYLIFLKGINPSPSLFLITRLIIHFVVHREYFNYRRYVSIEK